MRWFRFHVAIITLIGVALAQGPISAWAQPAEEARVNGFGGFFFSAQDPEGLADWYFENLGIARAPVSYDERPWRQEAGPTVFGPFPATSPFFEASDKVFMLNFRTRDLDALAAHLRKNGVAVDIDGEVYPNGRFARLTDPEGNLIQLWEPAEPQR